jgi:hypothetical protein
VSKRKPPSRRAERKPDEISKAIARVREDAKPEKPTVAEYPTENKSKSGRIAKATVVQPGVNQIAKRQKKG